MKKEEKKYDILVGIGCGREGIHAKEMPIDAALFLASAEIARKLKKHTKGVIVLADIAIKDEIAAYREERIRRIIAVLEIQNEWDLIRQSKVKNRDKQEVLLTSAVPEKDRAYYKEEVRDALLLLNNDPKRKSTKMGWAIDSRKGRGGEVSFDREIMQNRGNIEFLYEVGLISKRETQSAATPLFGIPLSSELGARKIPYLARENELKWRICLPVTPSQLAEEMEKLEATSPSELARKRLWEFIFLTQETGTDLAQDHSALKAKLEESLSSFFRREPA